MAAEKVITTTNMCVGMHARLMVAEKVITITTKNMRVGMHACKKARWTDACKNAYYQNISQMLSLHGIKFMVHSRGKLYWIVYMHQGILIPLC